MIPPSYVRVLEAIMRLHREHRHITGAAIERELGWSGRGYANIAILALQDAGLITIGEGRGGTIVPRVRFIPASELFAT